MSSAFHEESRPRGGSARLAAAADNFWPRMMDLARRGRPLAANVLHRCISVMQAIIPHATKNFDSGLRRVILPENLGEGKTLKERRLVLHWGAGAAWRLCGVLVLSRYSSGKAPSREVDVPTKQKSISSRMWLWHGQQICLHSKGEQRRSRAWTTFLQVLPTWGSYSSSLLPSSHPYVAFCGGVCWIQSADLLDTVVIQSAGYRTESRQAKKIQEDQHVRREK